MGQLGDRAIERVSGPAWLALRPIFFDVSDSLLSVGRETSAELTTIYVKYTVDSSSTSPVYAVVWLRSSRRLIVGLALPNDVAASDFVPTPTGTVYRGLTKYLIISEQKDIPASLRDDR